MILLCPVQGPWASSYIFDWENSFFPRSFHTFAFILYVGSFSLIQRQKICSLVIPDEAKSRRYQGVSVLNCWICNMTCYVCANFQRLIIRAYSKRYLYRKIGKFCENVENCSFVKDATQCIYPFENCYLFKDVLQCIPQCPGGCKCQYDKKLYKCNENSISFIPRDAHALDFSHSLFRIDEFEDEWFFLIHLNLSHCFITNIAVFERKNNFTLLRTLDLRYNNIERISKLELSALEELYLDGNPLYSIDIGVQLRKLSLIDTKMKSMILRSEPFMPLCLTLNGSRGNVATVTYITILPENGRTDLKWESKLVILNLSHNNIKDITGFCLRCSSLTRLDLSHNKIDKLSLTSFSGISSLKYLSLRGNRITVIKLEYLLNVGTLGELDLGQNMIYCIENNAFDRLLRLMILHLDHNRLLHIPVRLFRHIKYMYLLNVANNQISTMSASLLLRLKDLRYLNVSNNRLRLPERLIFRHNTGIKTLDIRNNLVDPVPEMFEGLPGLQKLYVDTFALCCARRVQIWDEECIYDQKIIPSCEELINIGVLKVFVWYFSVLCFLGNGMALWHRFRTKTLANSAHDVLVTQLCVADLFVGPYLLIIGVVDRYSEGQYAYMDLGWRQSSLCTLSGILITIANLSSALFVLLITVDKLLVMQCRQYTTARIQTTTVCSAFIWIMSFCLALIQGVPGLSTDIYSRTGFCLPFPMTRHMILEQNWDFAFGLHIVFRIGLYLLLCIGQMMIVCGTIRRKTKNKTNDRKRMKQATAIAVATVLTGSLCSLPTTVLGKDTVNVEPKYNEWF